MPSNPPPTGERHTVPPPLPLPNDDPMAAFAAWFAHAEASGVPLPEAVALATATWDGRPSARMVLLKGADADGLSFYTNFESRKAAELDANPRAAFCFHWATLERQVRFGGTVERLGPEASAAYFQSRPRGSRLGAWASLQSRPLAARGELEERLIEMEARFRGRKVPLPPFWGGYRLVPLEVEFWLGRDDRLHDRVRFTRPDPADGWQAERLYP
ncbi:MAG: pyridoxamine 5'-phosphate oxidase [Gemmatimonadetes bacterium]|nr:pyridoxamine 5'-phosphate oxidase [Gemmatimonadota bacterium]